MAEGEEQTIKALLVPFADDLWLQRRLKLGEVLAKLEDGRHTNTGRDWFQFVDFLGEHCSGTGQLTDKQWGELLNLMMISRKLNHKSVKFRDILANKQQIESNAQSIKQFNLAARLGQAIEFSLGELERLLQATRLTWRSPAEQIALSATREYLEGKCRPLARQVRLQLDDLKIQKDARLEGWRARETKLAASLKKMSEFVSTMINLQSKLSKIKYLDDGVVCGEDKPSLRSSVRESIESCRRDMREMSEFFRKIVGLLHQISKRTSTRSNGEGLLLVRVFEPREYISLINITSAVDQLHECQRQLDEIIQNLRREFGRFYFLNDVELLRVVMIDSKLVLDRAENNRITRKLFNDSIDSLLISDDSNHLTGVRSPSGEEMHFAECDYVPLKKPVQVYSLEIVRILNEVQRKLRRTLKSMLLKSLDARDIDWSLPIQLINLRESIKFCSSVENILNSDNCDLSPPIEFYQEQSRKLTTDKQPEAKISAVISMSVQFISLLMTMNREKIKSRNHWLWQKQVRYYVIDVKEIEVRIADAKFRYKFDFLPLEQQSTGGGQDAFKRLVSTRLTERCFLLASQAVCHLRLGANPFGPAGGGKTESIKALGRLLGQQVIVHNCDETNDIESLDRLIWGLAHTGLWGCFDEFNRLSLSTMSVVSSTLELVQSGIRENKTTVESQQSLMCIDRDSAFFITLNPASQGGAITTTTKRYRGRRQLPANLRNLFLPISMVRVQVDSIVGENLLNLSIQSGRSDFGGEDFAEIGQKLQSFLQHLKGIQLGEGRCEWDLRLITAALQRLRSASGVESGREKLSELMIGCLRSETEPRLTGDERAKFRDALREFGLPMRPDEVECSEQKVQQLRRQLETRTGVLLLGPTKSGKSQCWRRLMEEDQKRMEWIALNPKCFSQRELFGGLCEDGTGRRAWRDGCLTAKVREAQDLLAGQPQLEQVCLVLDGPVDPDWVESLNSVLDDNRVLTLSSGERLNFNLSSSQSIKLIFETRSIELASPATISRLGLVYFPQKADCSVKQVKLDRIDELGAYLETSRLTVIICKQISRYLDLYFRQLGGASIYSCSQCSDSSHLLDLLSRSMSQDRTYLIHNVELIGAQDQWETRTFVESLKFLLDYGGLYHGDEFEFKPIGDRSKFVLTCERSDAIDPRLASKADLIIHLELRSVVLDASQASLLAPEEILHHEGALVCLKNINQMSRREINDRLKASCSDKICTFSNSSKWRESLEMLEKQVDSSGASTAKILYVLYDHELELMSLETRGKLLHMLNWLDEIGQQAKFVLVCHGEIPKPFESMGEIVPLKSAEISTEILEKTFAEQEAWIRDNLSWSMGAKFDKERSESLLETFLNLYQTTSSSLALRQKALKNGLENLRDFDRQVEQTRQECQQQEITLRDKEQQINSTVESINLNLRQSERQRAQLDELRQVLESKRTFMVNKSGQLDAQLAQVGPMLEASKAQVLQHLKPEALNEIRTLRAPPETIKDILDALFILLGAKDLAWTAMKSYLASRSLRDELTSYEFERRLNKDMIAKVETLIRQRQESFTDDQARRASRAVVPLLSWIKSALEYGKVLLKSGPLREELSESRADLTRLDESAKKAETELSEIETNIREQEANLAKLRGESQELELQFEQIRRQLDKSQQLRTDLESQTVRWDQDLHRIDSLDTGKLVKLCLMAAHLAFRSSAHRSDLPFWLKNFDLDDDLSADWSEFISRRGPFGLMFNMTDTPDTPDSTRLVQLLALKLQLEFVGSPWIPFVQVGDSHGDDLIESLCRENILGLSPGEVVLSSSLVQAQQTQGAGLILLDARRLCQEWSALDLADYLLDRNAATRLILLGNADGLLEQSLGGYLVELSSVIATSDDKQRQNVDQVQASIENSIVAAKEPQLAGELARKQCQLEAKQKSMHTSEINLLNQLTTGGPVSEVVRVLGDLQQLNQELINESNLLEGLRRRLEAERASCAKSSLKCAKFYLNMLEPLGGFSEISLKKYTQMLLLSSSGESFDDDADEFKANRRLIVRHATHSMEPQARSEFVARLADWRKANNEEDCCAEGRFPPASASPANTQLGEIILNDVLAGANSDIARVARRATELVLVLHDPSKSSSPPIDYLFSSGCQDELSYDKVYATGDKMGQAKLAASLRRLASSSNSSAVLCVINAHLASDWLNSNLPEILLASEQEPENRRSISSDREKRRRVLILVGEQTIASPQERSLLFGRRLLDCAQLRYWHDELASGLVERFDTFRDAASAAAVADKQLVLFHVVCQERAKRNLWLHPSYNFDSDQLQLALATLRRLRGSGLEDELGNYLADVVYGPRMEREEDERALLELIGRFFAGAGAGNAESGHEQQLLDELRNSSQLRGEQLIAKLIGTRQ